MKEDSMSTSAVSVSPKPILQQPLTHGITWKLFTVGPDTFRKFVTGRNKFERWSKYLNLDDMNEKEIYNYAKKKKNDTIVLQCSETGALRAIRRRAANDS